MIKQIKIFVGSDGVPSHAIFDTANAAEGPDKGRRVKHIIYEDADQPGLFWHERACLVHDAKYQEPTSTEFISEREFFGKVRLVKFRDGALAETWAAVAQCVSRLNTQNQYHNENTTRNP